MVFVPWRGSILWLFNGFPWLSMAFHGFSEGVLGFLLWQSTYYLGKHLLLKLQSTERPTNSPGKGRGRGVDEREDASVTPFGGRGQRVPEGY